VFKKSMLRLSAGVNNNLNVFISGVEPIRLD
jgi:hypothetical protein